MISALSAINGLILTGSRVFRSLGDDHRLFHALAVWDRRLGVPMGAIVAQALVSLLLIAAVGTAGGQRLLDRCLSWFGLQPLPWADYHGGFETLVAGTAPVFWAFFLLTGIALFVLRIRDKHRLRPFSTPWYPLPPLVFCLTCLFMLHASLDYAKGLCLIALAPVALGVPLYLFSGRPSIHWPTSSRAARSAR
jgi:amino acid transporter